MITKDSILSNLNDLDELYRNSKSIKKSNFFSKLAVFELCGWVEESMDDVIRRCYKKRLKEDQNIKLIENEIIGQTYGFHYKKNFRPMLMKILGIIVIENIERKLDKAKFEILTSTLGDLKTSRDKTAHTHIKGTITSLDAPSLTIGKFYRIYEGLMDIDRVLRKLKIL